jgi:hypothetical protein
MIKLTFTLKDGKKGDLKLPVLGSYRNSAPYDCPKTNAIITQTADALVKSRNFGRGGMNIGLLATGEDKYIKVVRDFLHRAAWAKPDHKVTETKVWYLAYTNLLLSLAAHGGLERGHTGHYFNQLWTGLAADLSGPQATAAFFRKTRWLHTLNRTWDGNFTYDCSAYKNGIFSYRGLSDTGSHLLNYCGGRNKLHITGKDPDKSLWLPAAGIDEAISLADYGIAQKSEQELLDLFSHPMPQIRVQAIWALRAILEEKPADTLGYLDEKIGRSLNSLTKDPYSDKLVDQKNKTLFYAAIAKLLKHKRHPARASGSQLIKNMPIDDFHLVADQAVAIIKDKNRTFHSYHGLGPQTNVIEMLANLKIAGGIESAFKILESPGGKAGFKLRLLMSVLPKYGANAKYALPKIKATNAGKFQKQWDAMIKKIEATSGAKKMRPIEEAKRIGLKK